MTIHSLGRLERVDLRGVWTSESSHFTPWLAREENIRLLSEAIGVELELEAQEQKVGPFRADILCKDVTSDHWVLIENQLERTDHIHLGQLLTYAAGLKAVTIVWIARNFTDEHRATLDWLNEITDERFNFFGVEIELWKIGESAIAPKFNIVSKPNDWMRVVAESAHRVERGELTEKKALQVRFWTAFSDYAARNAKRIRTTKPLPQHWMNVAIGRSGFKLSAIASFWNSEEQNFDKNEIRTEVEIHAPEAKQYFALLEREKPAIEAELGQSLTWHNPPEARACRIYLRQDAQIDDETGWPKQHEWLLANLESLHRVFAERVRSLAII
jgi:hypothetical protein